MSVVTINYTDNVAVVAAANLARGSTARGTLDLRAKLGARLFVRIGRQGTTALTNGVDVLIRALLNNDAAQGAHPAGIPALLSSTVAASSTTVSTDSNSGQPLLTVASGTGFAAGDTISIVDASFTPTRLEFHRISKISGGAITLDRNLAASHTSVQGDRVINKADVFAPVWLDGGTLYECVFDYGDDAAGESVTVEARAQTLDSYTNT